MLAVRTLEGVTSSELYEVYKESFCDYPVDLGFDERKLMLILHKLGGRPEHSFAAFEGDKPVGFASCGIRTFKGRPTGYVALTGVSIHHRRKGAGRAMMEAAKDHFRALGIKHFLLEVISTNAPAYGLYRSVGLETSRVFGSYALDSKGDMPLSDIDIRIMAPNEAPWDVFSSFWDFPPCWQNSIESIGTIPDIELVAAAYEGGDKLVGYAACSCRSCAIDHLAVRKDRRNRGIGSALMAFIAEHTPSQGMSIANIEEGCRSLEDFVKHRGFRHTLSLHELEMEL